MKRTGFWILLLTCVGIAVGLVAVKDGHAEYGDIVLNSKSVSMQKAGVDPVVFPHWFHRIRFKCKVCHEDIFILKKGANDINMAAIMNGEFCGKCHNGLVAWEPLYCDRCHSFKGAGAPK
jgi:c(7)-type cytochrome triheme protein